MIYNSKRKKKDISNPNFQVNEPTLVIDFLYLLRAVNLAIFISFDLIFILYSN